MSTGKQAVKGKKRIAIKAVNDYIYYLTDKKRIIFSNLLAGVMRGIGSAVGFWIVSALIIAVLSFIAGRSPFVRRLVELFEEALKKYSG